MPKKERIITPFGAALGRRLRQAREAVEPPLTQVDIARLLDRSKGAVCKWESGENEPNSSCIIALSRLYGVTVDWLIGLEAGPAHKRANPPVAVTGTVPVVSSSHAARWSFEAPMEVLVTAKQYSPGTAAAILVDSAAMAKTCPSGSHAVPTRFCAGWSRRRPGTWCWPCWAINANLCCATWSGRALRSCSWPMMRGIPPTHSTIRCVLWRGCLR